MMLTPAQERRASTRALPKSEVIRRHIQNTSAKRLKKYGTLEPDEARLKVVGTAAEVLERSTHLSRPGKSVGPTTNRNYVSANTLSSCQLAR
jgi:hypothetical protein